MGNYVDVSSNEVNDHVRDNGSIVTTVSASTEIVDGDKISDLWVTTGSANVTITLTTTMDSRSLNIKKIDDGTGIVSIVGNVDRDTDKDNL